MGAAYPLPPSTPTAGIHVPWAAGGAHYENGHLTSEAEAWPDFDVTALRLWDTRTTWADVEPSDDAWSFGHLDAHLAVAQSHGTDDVLLVLAGTPAWAARDPLAKGAPWLAAGSASPPQRMDDWRDYVRTIATRYAGRIDAYQIGNEPNHSWFWQGSPSELARLVRAGVHEIRRADPHARVIGAAPIVTTRTSTTAAAAWWRALAGTGIDALAFQWYPRRGTSAGTLGPIVDRLRAGVKGTDLARTPVWITEVNHRGGGRRAGALVDATMSAAARHGVARVYWYAWTAIGPPGLLSLQQGSAAARALEDYAVTRRVR